MFFAADGPIDELPPSPGRRAILTPIGVFVLVIVLCAGLLLVVRSIIEARGSAHRAVLAGRIATLGLGIYRHHETHGSMPAAYGTDRSGTPTSSWRLALLPSIEGDHIYNSYNLGWPWAAPENSTAASTKLGLFVRPTRDYPRDSVNAELLVVVGRETAFPGPVGLRFDQIPDGTSNTILIVEAAESSIRWAEPRDLPFAGMDFRVNGPRKSRSIGSPYRCAEVLMADGSYRSLPNRTPPATLRALLTIDGGEAIPGWDGVR